MQCALVIPEHFAPGQQFSQNSDRRYRNRDGLFGLLRARKSYLKEQTESLKSETLSSEDGITNSLCTPSEILELHEHDADVVGSGQGKHLDCVRLLCSRSACKSDTSQPCSQSLILNGTLTSN